MSSLPKFTFPETLGGRHGTTSPTPQSPPTSPSSARAPTSKQCIFVVQAYLCFHHPKLSAPHLLHRSPCPQALLPPAQQVRCENYFRRDGELLQVVRYDKERGCMECKAEARTRRDQEAADHVEIIEKMRRLGLESEAEKQVIKFEGKATIAAQNPTTKSKNIDLGKKSVTVENRKYLTPTKPKIKVKQEKSTLPNPTPTQPKDKSDSDTDDSWDLAKEKEKKWGEVALAPGETTAGRDAWVVIGSWGEDEEDWHKL
ncbi:hypothetical protein SBOR_4492 [Sclerotinia borealis F-4128]|uniref:Uncharacterized protein n=1 Tax=Sclerotinia borealis (strain F-4128) TaxID=1432307 RepID=W9CKS0_SCLBF|nr:hypothetical protein SBOR_4492 [Sclerotinia borealis F-4128]